MRFALIISIIVAALATVFALSNTATVSVNFLSWSFSAPLALLIISTLVGGILVGYLSALPGRLKSASEARTLKKELEAAKATVAAPVLEAAPIAEPTPPSSEGSPS